jgi:hypothetical protein
VPASSGRTSNVCEAVEEAAARLAAGLLDRHDRLAERTRRIRDRRPLSRLSSLPAQLVLGFVQPEGPACPVISRLLEEAMWAPERVFRAVAALLCSAQADRFAMAVYREQIDSLLVASGTWPVQLNRLTAEGLVSMIQEAISPSVPAIGLWASTPQWANRDATRLAECLRSQPDVLPALAALQRAREGTGGPITSDGIGFRVPPPVVALAEGCVSSAPGADALADVDVDRRVQGLADRFREEPQEPRFVQVPVPLDLLVLEPTGGIWAIAMVRRLPDGPDHQKIRKSLIFIRYLMHYAFGARNPEDIRVVAALFADRREGQAPRDERNHRLLGEDELWGYHRFWDYVAGRAGGAALVEQVATGAADALTHMECQRPANRCPLGPAEVFGNQP